MYCIPDDITKGIRTNCDKFTIVSTQWNKALSFVNKSTENIFGLHFSSSGNEEDYSLFYCKNIISYKGK